MMGKSIWSMVGVAVFSCLPLMGVREDTNNFNFLNILKTLVPDLTQAWDTHRDGYSRMREIIDFLVAINEEPGNILNTGLVRQRGWSLIFRGIDNVERFGRELTQGMQGTRVLAQAVMELEEAQRNGAPEEEISELRHRAFDAWQALLQIFTEMGDGVAGNIGREREEAAEDLRFTEAFQRFGTETGIGRR